MKNILILLFASFAIIACGGEEDKKGSSSGSTDRWSESDKDSFRKQMCVRFDENQCNCAIAEVSKDYNSFEEFSSKMDLLVGYDEILRGGGDRGPAASDEEMDRMFEEIEEFDRHMNDIGRKCERVGEEVSGKSSSSSNAEVEIAIKNIVQAAGDYFLNNGELPPDCWETMEEEGFLSLGSIVDSLNFACSWGWDDFDGIYGTVAAYNKQGLLCEYDIASEDFFWE